MATKKARVADLFLFDTSAFIALTDREPGFERVQHLLKEARRGAVLLHACFVSLTEVRYILAYDRGAEKAGRVVAAIQKFPMAWHHSDDDLCASAAKIKVDYKLSLADCFVAALSERLKATLVHKDPEFSALPAETKQELLPLKGAATGKPSN
jgi:predicted nucleic acid-binding protein